MISEGRSKASVVTKSSRIEGQKQRVTEHLARRSKFLAYGCLVAIAVAVLSAALLLRNAIERGGRLERGASLDELARGKIEANIDRARCGPEFFYHFRLGAQMLRLPAVRRRGVIWPTGGAVLASPGYDPETKVVCGNTPDLAPKLTMMRINLQSELLPRDVGATRLGELLARLSTSNVASLTFRESTAQRHGRPSCYDQPRLETIGRISRTEIDGSRIFELKFQPPKGRGGKRYGIVISAGTPFPAHNRSIYVWDPKWGGHLSTAINCLST